MEKNESKRHSIFWSYGVLLLLTFVTLFGLGAANLLVRVLSNGTMDYSTTLIISGFIVAGILMIIILMWGTKKKL